MQKLDEVVTEVVRQFVKDGVLFTGLDVSNKVKETLPFARHSDVSELVRLSFSSEMETNGYSRSPIDVTLKDGSTKTALLYHLVSDAWDFDNKYDSQKRNQVSARPVTPVVPVPATVSANGTVTVTPAATIPVTSTPQIRDLWAQLFKSQPSLFPRK